MPDTIRHFFNLSLIFICLVFTAYVTRMVLSYLVQRFRFLYGRKPTVQHATSTQPLAPPPLPDTETSDHPEKPI